MPQQLYQQLIIDHNRAPIGKDNTFCFSHSMDGENPSCGDELTLYLKLSQQHIENIGFNSDACAICTASASLLCEQLHG
ncbi:MAG: iron-sulfur cluster assembly scaffold protein, partial [Algicola sp.]|nr:iron-sulfur cluster assembly scaffold protein [Algicola sp.]